MRKKFGVMVCAVALCGLLCSCEAEKTSQKVSLILWGAENEQELLRDMSDKFCEHYKNEAEIEIHIGVEPESDFKKDYLKNVENGADVFSFADDQLYELVSHDSLLPITIDADRVKEENGGEQAAAVQSAKCSDVLYACPKTASNGYFMFYNNKYFSKEDIKSLDKMLKKAEKLGKKIYMDWSSGWYIYSFFGGAGFELKLNPDRLTNSCNWNGTCGNYKGTDVAEAMLKISSSSAFYSGKDKDFQKGIKEGEIIAGVSGTWNVECVSQAFGPNYAACKLPCYTLCGKQVQMASFSGYKLVGVNSSTDYPEWAQRLALWITNEENQTKRFEKIGEGPSNVNALRSENVQKSLAIQALTEQRQFSIAQKVGGNFWDAATAFGMVMVSGNKDNMDLQKLLDTLVQETEAPLKNVD